MDSRNKKQPTIPSRRPGRLVGVLLFGVLGWALASSQNWFEQAPRLSPVQAVAGPTPNRSAQPAMGVVKRLFDGDSMLIGSDGRIVQVRLWGIDCPERGQPFSKKARARTQALTQGQQVRIEPRATRDRYGRVLAELILPDGRSVGRILVAEGLAWHYRQYAGDDADLARREQQARSQQLAIWSDEDPVAPWDYRRQQKRISNR